MARLAILTFAAVMRETASMALSRRQTLQRGSLAAVVPVLVPTPALASTKTDAEKVLEALQPLSGFVDDGKTQVPDWKGLLQSFKEHLEMADKNNMSFKATKTCFGTKTVEFYGRTISCDGVCHAPHNLEPLKTMTAPQDLPGLRRVLGVCVQHKDAIENFSFIARPLHDLTRKGREWQWRRCREQCIRSPAKRVPPEQSPGGARLHEAVLRRLRCE